MILFVFLRGKIPIRVTAPRFELTLQRQKVSKLPTEPPGRLVQLFSFCSTVDKKVLNAGRKYYLIFLSGAEHIMLALMPNPMQGFVPIFMSMYRMYICVVITYSKIMDQPGKRLPILHVVS